METVLQLPIVDLYSPDRTTTASSIRQACIDCGFFYLVNHGIEEEFLLKVFDESQKFFSLPAEMKMKLARKENRGYSPLYEENLDPESSSKGDSKEGFLIGPLADTAAQCDLNQWPPEEILPLWRDTIQCYYRKLMHAGNRLVSLIALALNLDENFFEEVGALNDPMVYLRLMCYPGEVESSDGKIIYGASAHSDYGMITLLATNGVPGLQVCRNKSRQPRVWEDVIHIDGALIVNIGDLMERWTNCLFRSTLHRVMPTGKERYSMAFFFNPNPDCVVECLESCCSDSCPPRFPPIRSEDYVMERINRTYNPEGFLL